MAVPLPGERLQILVVSARESVRDEVDAALAGRLGEVRVHWVSQPDLATVRILDLAPDAVLVDDALEGASPASVIARIVKQVPQTAVLALVSAGSVTSAQQTVLAGARGFVTKPIAQEELINALRVLLMEPIGAEARPPGRIVVFCAPKGGTGRTTLAINTAISLQNLRREEPVALVDADYSAPSVDVALNLDPRQNITALLSKLHQLDDELVRGVMATHASGIRVLLAPPPADLSNPISLPEVQQILVWLKRMFAWVVVDLGLPLDETAFAFLDGADRIVMTVLPEMVGLRNTRLMLDQLLSRGYPEEKVWLVLNQATREGGISHRDIENRLRIKVWRTVPEDQALVTYSVNRGVPLVMSHPRSAVARVIRSLAEDLAKEMPVEEPLAKRRSAPAEGLKGLLRRAS